MNNQAITVSVQQPSIPTYRKDFFEKLNRKVSVTLFYGYDDVPSALPHDVNKIFYSLRILRIGMISLKWHFAQLKAVSKKFNVSILSWDIQYITLWLSIIKSLIIRQPLILWGHGYSKNENAFKRKIRNLPLPLTKSIILYDYHTANELKKIRGLEKKIFVAPNSPNDQVIKSAKEHWLNDISRLQEFQLKNKIRDTFNVLYIGRVYKENRLDILFKGFKLALTELNSIRLIIIGNENGFANELKKLSVELDINEKIIWAGSIYDEYQIAPWMLSSKVFCYPANVGLSIIHAFAYGLPAITNADYTSHNPEIWAFENGINGLAFPKDDYTNLANNLLRLYKDGELLKKLSMNANETVSKNYNIDKMLEGFLQAIKHAIR